MNETCFQVYGIMQYEFSCKVLVRGIKYSQIGPYHTESAFVLFDFKQTYSTVLSKLVLQ